MLTILEKSRTFTLLKQNVPIHHKILQVSGQINYVLKKDRFS